MTMISTILPAAPSSTSRASVAAPARDAIVVEDVSKQFHLSRTRPSSVRETVQGLLFGREDHDRVVKALEDVSFSVLAGESFGIVGTNGSGKSTLLKLLAGTLTADRGKVQTQGRVSALIELAAGFHPEFTGRENVLLSGSLLGMRRSEMRRRFDSIVAFAELEDFIDVPVKYYSSGMYARLGFSVAIHVDPDILLVDEVLAVGDGRFHLKCFSRFEELKAAGTTIVFVSHSLAMVRTICDRAVWLERGEVRALGTTGEVLDQYEPFLLRGSRVGQPQPKAATPSVTAVLQASQQLTVTPAEPDPADAASSTPSLALVGLHVMNEAGEAARRIRLGERLSVRIGVVQHAPVAEPAVSINLVRDDGLQCYGTILDLDTDGPLPPGQERWFEFELPHWPLLGGTFHFAASVGSKTLFPTWEDQRTSMVLESLAPLGPDDGIFRPSFTWQHVSSAPSHVLAAETEPAQGREDAIPDSTISDETPTFIEQDSR